MSNHLLPTWTEDRALERIVRMEIVEESVL